VGTRVLIVQHAEKQATPGDPGLSETGFVQAQAAADKLAGLTVGALYSSPLRRALETARPISARLGLEVCVDERLVERMSWAGEDQPLKEFLAEWRRVTHERDFRPRSGESSRSAGTRFHSALCELAGRHPDTTIVVVSHGGVTVDLARDLVGDEVVEEMAPGIIDAGVANCAITEVVEEAGGLRVLTLGSPEWEPKLTTRAPLRPVTDGLVRLRPPGPGDARVLVGGRDEVFHRWLGPGADEPSPTACIEAGGEVVGWVDYDADRAWLTPGEINVGYNVFAPYRHQGYATRAVQLLMHHMAVATDQHAASLLIHPENRASLAVAARTGFGRLADVDGSAYFRRPVPPLAYADGVVTVRRPRISDLDADFDAKDDEQILWLWLPGQREAWEAMSADEQRTHAARGLVERISAFGPGPKWTFSVDSPGTDYVAYIDCDLANEHVQTGEANISYSSHPDHRGRGYVSRAVRLVMRFLTDHTGCREAHILVDSENVASLRVPAAVGMGETARWTNDAGRTMIRHVKTLERPVPAS